MSRTTVLTAFQTYLNTGIGTIPFLAKVYITPPKITPQGMFFFQPGIGTGAIIELFCSDQVERRMEMRGGQPNLGEHGKFRIYTVDLVCILRTVSPGDPSSGDSLIGSQNDAFLDGLVKFIEDDPTLGKTVFSAGEGSYTQKQDMHLRTSLPFFTDDSAMAQMDSVLQVTVLEFMP